LPDSDDYQISIAGIPPPIKVRDISRGGIGFTARHPVKVGDGLDVWLYNEGLGSWLKKRVRVVYLSDTRDAGYLIGGRFLIELVEAELRGFSSRQLTPPDRDPRERIRQAPAASSSRDVLIIDDSRDVADSLAALLTDHGHSVRVAYHGRQAIAMAAERPPLIALVDLAMPDVDGYTVLRELRKLPGMDEAKLVCLTGSRDEESHKRASACGCDGLLVKPVDVAEIEKFLDESGA
jgi:CheY-like chemotaxis protein